MSVPWLVDVPQLRTAPEDIRRRLREIDPTVEVIYLGRGRWIVGKVRPNQHVRARAIRMLDEFHRNLQNKKKLSERGKEKVLFALLALQGFRPVADYTMPEPDGTVVKDFERSRFLWLHTSENELWRQLDGEMDRPGEEARKVLGDPSLAREALSRAFKLNFGRASQAPEVTPLASGPTRHITL